MHFRTKMNLKMVSEINPFGLKNSLKHFVQHINDFAEYLYLKRNKINTSKKKSNNNAKEALFRKVHVCKQICIKKEKM